MTPQQIDDVTTGLVKVYAFLDAHGPGLLAAAIAGGLWVLYRKTAPHRRRRRAVAAQRRQVLLERQQMARLTAAIDAAPLIPTQPGQDNDLLGKCNQILNATNARKEKPQP
jgi:hypothetical protein